MPNIAAICVSCPESESVYGCKSALNRFFASMAKQRQSFQKAELESKKKKKNKEKEEKREQRKANSNKGKGLESMMAWVDHNGQLTNEPPDPKLKVEIKLEDIVLGSNNISDGLPDEPNTGKVSMYNTERKFGFITDKVSQLKYFFHISDAPEEIKEGDQVSFEITSGAKGPAAIKVQILPKAV
jgi:cold shock CspA family protein